MIPNTLQASIKTFITEKTGTGVSSIQFSALGGGSINQAFKIVTNKNDRFFCKINSVTRFPNMFDREQSGLELLRSQKVIRVPVVIGNSTFEDFQFLLLEYIEEGIRTDKFWTAFGEQLAHLHSTPYPSAGLEEDNYMGALPQFNQMSANWIDFFIGQRIEPQVKLAVNKGLLTPKQQRHFEKLYLQFPRIFPINSISLLHGDLWSGNFLCDHSGMPVLIDPAVYRGHPAMDLAMTTLFGGFDSLFYQSYSRKVPFPEDHRHQWEICNLYPLLIHLNLFGRGYLQSIVSVIQYY